MKRISIAFFVVLMAASLEAQILERFIDVTWDARNALNVDTADLQYLPAYEANVRIREGMSAVNRLTAENRTNVVVPTAVLTYKYGLPDSVTGSPDTTVLSRQSITSVQWIKADTIKTLRMIPRAGWYEQEHQWCKANEGMLARPSHWDFYDDTLYVHPVPWRVDTLYVTTVDNIYGLDTVTTLAAIKEDYRPAILKYVVYETAKARQHPLVAMYKQDYEMLWLSLFPNFRPQVQGAQ